jgi:rhamnosyltransferase
VERLYPFVAQDEGYYTGWVMSDYFARMELTNLHYMLRDIHTKFFCHYDIYNRQDMLNIIGQQYDQLSLKAMIKLLIKKKLPPAIYSLLLRVKNRMLRTA